jgi:hypothetical protein
MAVKDVSATGFRPTEVRKLSANEVTAHALAYGSTKKRNNAMSAMLSGILPAIVIGHYFPTTWQRCVMGVIVGLVWSNAFEYVYHRWLLHCPTTLFGKGHLLHHSSVGTPEEAEHATFGESPVYVMALFVVNGVPAILGEYFLHTGLVPGLFIGWAIYMVAVEEIHWRFHLGGWLPLGLGEARTYHLAHHDIPDGRYNVFFPLFDFLMGNMTPPMEQIQLPAYALNSTEGRRKDPGLATWVRETVCITWALILLLDYRFLTGSK